MTTATKRYEQAAIQPINQCDGCKLGLPVNESGIHFHPDKKGWVRNHMVCTKREYPGIDNMQLSDIINHGPSKLEPLEVTVNGELRKVRPRDDLELKVVNPKPIGAPPEDAKRFYLGTQIRFECPVCGANCVHRLDEDGLSYPPFNEPFEYVCYCDECSHEWEASCKLRLNVELEVIQNEEDK